MAAKRHAAVLSRSLAEIVDSVQWVNFKLKARREPRRHTTVAWGCESRQSPLRWFEPSTELTAVRYGMPCRSMTKALAERVSCLEPSGYRMSGHLRRRVLGRFSRGAPLFSGVCRGREVHPGPLPLPDRRQQRPSRARVPVFSNGSALGSGCSRRTT